MLGDRPFLGSVVILFFGAAFLVFVLSLHPRASALTLRDDGFEYTSLFRKHFVKWSDVSEFGIVNIATNRMVCWNYAPAFAGSPKSRKTSRSLAGYEAGLPDSYGMPATELLDILKSVHRDRTGAVG